jgi:cyclomaltodextrinase / maltogenic alpha-amylase / neopullulanase
MRAERYCYPVASWAEHAIWWHVYPLGFTGAEKAALAPDAWFLGEMIRGDYVAYAAESGLDSITLGA